MSVDAIWPCDGSNQQWRSGFLDGSPRQLSQTVRAFAWSSRRSALLRVGDLSGQSLPVMRRELVCGFPTVSWSADSKGDRGGVAEGRPAETVGTFPLHAEQRAGSQ